MRALLVGLGLAVGFVALGARGRMLRGRPHAPKASAAMHAEARRDAREAFMDVVHAEPTTNELRTLEAVALHETTFGYGWAGDGAGSFNMGAVQGDPNWTGATFGGTDTHPTATGAAVKYSATFKRYPSAIEGWRDLVRELYIRRPSVRQAARGGNPLDVATAMRRTKYYEGAGSNETERIKGYGQALADMLWEIDRN